MLLYYALIKQHNVVEWTSSDSNVIKVCLLYEFITLKKYAHVFFSLSLVALHMITISIKPMFRTYCVYIFINTERWKRERKNEVHIWKIGIPFQNTVYIQSSHSFEYDYMHTVRAKWMTTVFTFHTKTYIHVGHSFVLPYLRCPWCRSRSLPLRVLQQDDWLSPQNHMLHWPVNLIEWWIYEYM